MKKKPSRQKRESVAYKVGKGKPPKHSQFKPGNNANPIGAKAHNPAVRALKQITIESYREIIELVMTKNIKTLKEVINHPDTSAVQVGVAKAFLKAIRNGDYGVIERIAERIVGKIPDQLNVNSNQKFDPVVLRAAMLELKSSI
jgi:hypothetical protein